MVEDSLDDVTERLEVLVGHRGGDSNPDVPS
jgi:hypothetical protein